MFKYLKSKFKKSNKVELKPSKNRRIWLRKYTMLTYDINLNELNYHQNKNFVNNSINIILPILENRIKNENITLQINPTLCKREKANGIYQYYNNYNKPKHIYLGKNVDNIDVIKTLIHEIGHNILHEKKYKQSEDRADIISYYFLKNIIFFPSILYFLYKFRCRSVINCDLLKNYNEKQIIKDYLKLKKKKYNRILYDMNYHICEKEYKNLIKIMIENFNLKNYKLKLKLKLKN
jgi:hypothetical protein